MRPSVLLLKRPMWRRMGTRPLQRAPSCCKLLYMAYIFCCGLCMCHSQHAHHQCSTAAIPAVAPSRPAKLAACSHCMRMLPALVQEPFHVTLAVLLSPLTPEPAQQEALSLPNCGPSAPVSSVLRLGRPIVDPYSSALEIIW